VEAFDANTALIMAVDSPAVILKTKDGGKSWKEVFRDNRKGMFLDAMDFTPTEMALWWATLLTVNCYCHH
jgi:photosystem II stability/assembly factor-like uncharacterized protein